MAGNRTTKTAARSNIKKAQKVSASRRRSGKAPKRRQAPTELAHRARGFFVEVCVSQTAQGTAYRCSARPQRDRQVQPGRGRQQVGARCCVAAYQVGGQEVRDRDLTQAQGSFALSRRLERPRPTTSWSSRLPTRSASPPGAIGSLVLLGVELGCPAGSPLNAGEQLAWPDGFRS